jgi:hypothetical protein
MSSLLIDLIDEWEILPDFGIIMHYKIPDKALFFGKASDYYSSSLSRIYLTMLEDSFVSSLFSWSGSLWPGVSIIIISLNSLCWIFSVTAEVPWWHSKH